MFTQLYLESSPYTVGWSMFSPRRGIPSLPPVHFLRLLLFSALSLSLSSCGDDSPTKPAANASPPAVPRKVVDNGRHPTLSPDGLWIAFGLGFNGLARTDTAGGQFDTLATDGSDPSWSRTANLIVARSGDQLFTIDPTTGTGSLVGTGGIDGDPEWSPDGAEIAVRKTAGGDAIAIVGYPGGMLTTISCVQQGGGTCAGEGPTWSPDGAWLAFEDGLEILKVARAGGTAEIIVDNLRDVFEPAWSPDGKSLAFAMDDSNGSDVHIWVSDARGKAFGLRQITSGAALDRAPAWSPDSRTIYFASDRGGTQAIWKVDFTP